ncbi:MAG: phytoene/squalene synthase family protein [Saprospiraceae bacterium]|nr:phytoene/squalene synthase family protein [Saprospiraceae bacterium]MBK8671199.1 phytoene/squalene synthase family protein [Saprospiraceae bacterium]
MDIFTKVCYDCSRLITHSYSTSFSLGIRMFSADLRMPVYAIYGFVRFADEIVDTFHDKDKARLLSDFRHETFKAIHDKISLNPVLHTFQQVVNTYHIDHALIESFLDSMEMDLEQTIYSKQDLDLYIYGSAEVVGLMCLKVFLEGNEAEYNRLKPFACALGAAFQKINFLRDMKSDFLDRGRVYFPDVDFHRFTEEEKKEIEDDIANDFSEAYKGIIQLPASSRLGVYCAYKYYLNLFYKIKKLPAKIITERRIRVSDKRKLYLLTTSAFQNQFGLI